MKGYLPSIILWLIAICLFIISEEKSFIIKSPSTKDWDRVRACIARSQKILSDEAMKSHVLIDWDNVTPEESDRHKRLTSRLTVEKHERDAQCREKYSL